MLIVALAAWGAAARAAPEPAPEPEPAAEPEPAPEPVPEPVPEPEPAPEPAARAPVEIPPVDEDLPSALDTLAGVADDRAAAGEIDPAALRRLPLRSLVRSRLSFHPLAGWTTLLGPSGGHAVSVGGGVGHQLYTLDVLPVRLGLDSRLEATAPIGAARGHRVDLRSALVSWLGPVGVSLGPTLRWDHQAWTRGPTLAPALLAGAELGLAVDGGPVQARIAVAPAGRVAGERGRAVDPLLPVLLDETTWSAGVRWSGRPLHLGLDAAVRESAVGPAIEAGVSIHWQPL